MNASLAKLLECYLCFVALLSFLFVCLFVYLVGSLEREIWKRDIHKSDNPPTSPFYHYIKEETSRAKNRVQKGSMASTSKELRAVALENYFFIIILKVWKFTSHWGKEGKVHLFFYRVT